MSSGFRWLTAVFGFLALGLAGCAQIPGVPPPEPTPVIAEDLPPVKANGSIFQAHRGTLALFEDRRPRRSGDIITIVLDEQVSASKNANSNANRSAGGSLNLDQLPDGLEELARLAFELSGEHNFTGGGGSQARNTFTGTITATVHNVLPNGNLRVVGEKRITINRGTEYIRFSGVVNPHFITPQNTVPSTQVADARIEYTGDGYISEAQRMGWLQRFFLNLSPY